MFNSKYNLPDSVLKSEFPQLWMEKVKERQERDNNRKKKRVFIDQDKDSFYMQKGDDIRAQRYILQDYNRSIQRPELTETTHLNADTVIRNWGNLNDDNIFDTTNKNWGEIRDYLQAVTRKINALTDFVIALEPYLDKIAANKDIDISDILADQTDRYFKKSDVIQRVNHLQKQVDNLSKMPEFQPEPNSTFPLSYSGDKDINDIITDATVADKINSLDDEDEKGE